MERHLLSFRQCLTPSAGLLLAQSAFFNCFHLRRREGKKLFQQILRGQRGSRRGGWWDTQTQSFRFRLHRQQVRRYFKGVFLVKAYEAKSPGRWMATRWKSLFETPHRAQERAMAISAASGGDRGTHRSPRGVGGAGGCSCLTRARFDSLVSSLPAMSQGKSRV